MPQTEFSDSNNQGVNSGYQSIYERWLTHRELVYPKPKARDYRDILLEVIQAGVILGSMVLSGTRVGATLARVGVFKSFGVLLLGEGSSLLGLFVLGEAFLSFLTIELAIFLAGYLTGEEVEDKRWYWSLLGAALLTSLVANLFPIFTLIGEEWSGVALVIVSSITGLCVSIMPFVGGRVLGVTKLQTKISFDLALDVWLVKTQKSWSSSQEYRQWKQLQKLSTPDLPPNSIEESVADKQQDNLGLDLQKIHSWLTNKGTSVSLGDLSQEFGLEQNFLMDVIANSKQFTLDGFKVSVA